MRQGLRNNLTTLLCGCRCTCQSPVVLQSSKRFRLPESSKLKARYSTAAAESGTLHDATPQASTSNPSLNGRPFRLAVVGSGPAGFYAASRVLSSEGSENAQVDMFEELPVPFGLVRYGVAPDHPEVKNCIHKFEETAEDKRFRYFGNVRIGTPLEPEPKQYDTGAVRASVHHALSLPLSFLKPYYDAILFTYGASYDRSLGPGVRNDDAPNLLHTLSARSFVHWYNGHPHSPFHQQGKEMGLDALTNATIIGQGNVALDCARILLSGREPPTINRLKKTDTPESVLEALSRSTIKHVDVVGRRGPLQFAGTTKELRELVNLDPKHAQFIMSSDDAALVKEASQTLESFTSQGGKTESARMKKRLLQLMQKAKADEKFAKGDTKTWSLSFCKSPVAIEGSEENGTAGPVKSVTFEQNDLLPASNAVLPSNDLVDPTSFVARGTGLTVSRPTDLLLKSVGYRSGGIEGLPFDQRRGVVKNVEGRVQDDSGDIIPGLYVSGWLARGPNGVIATTMYDAFQTAETIITDAAAASSTKSLPDLPRLPDAGFGNKQVVSWSDWKAIDAEERRRGKALGKEREKFVRVDDMLKVVQ
ncbi:nucleotide-binding domain-containing protein [Cystobasidium minutum MCA 4210]|uniref:nucleotide-binding domain-containing protein n=1 Tax=Cystobasidium minutum MCA 4210 TaxID=1397322 RepID=UPI0034CD6D6A|eukprot:jgi/Rhomi1/156593/estExt_Genewise1Plus.C_1_t10225